MLQVQMHAWAIKPEEGIRSPEIVVTSSCELSEMGVEALLLQERQVHLIDKLSRPWTNFFLNFKSDILIAKQFLFFLCPHCLWTTWLFEILLLSFVNLYPLHVLIYHSVCVKYIQVACVVECSFLSHLYISCSDILSTSLSTPSGLSTGCLWQLKIWG